MKLRIKDNKREFMRPLEQRQAEKLAEIGFCLCQMRLQRSTSLEEVAAKTRIQRRQLQAIEEAQLDELPEPVYIQSFIKQYGDALGLDGAELSSSFPSDSSQRVTKGSWKRWPVAQLRPIHLYLLYVFLIVSSVSGLSSFMNRSDLQASSSQQQKSVAYTTKGSKAIAKLPLSSNSNAPVDAAKANKLVRVGVTMKAQSWIRVVVDGKTQFEGILPEGTQRTWIADQKLSVRAGNAGGVLVAFNEEQAKQLGSPGSVEEVTYKANSKS